jgi:ribosome-associated protein
MKNDSLVLLNAIAQAIYDKKGTNILALDLRSVTPLTDYVIIAEGAVDKHVMAIARAVEEGMKKLGETPRYFEGMRTGDWVVLDYVEIMVHLFMPGLREKYHLEDLWKNAEIVDLSINVSNYDSAG